MRKLEGFTLTGIEAIGRIMAQQSLCDEFGALTAEGAQINKRLMD